jgi:predicted nucleic acid-binding protein
VQVKPVLADLIAAGIYISDALQEILLRDVGEA